MDTPCVFCDHPKNKTNTNCAKCGRLLKPKADTPMTTSEVIPEKSAKELSFDTTAMAENKNPNLFTCPDCENLCSKTAKTCPRCGCVFNSGSNNLERLST